MASSMSRQKIENIQKINSEIKNFIDCYKGNELWGDIGGCVSPERLIEFLIENPHFQKIADSINKLET